MSYEAPDYFLSYPNREKLIQDIVKWNITAIPMMISMTLPHMVKRKRGIVINISSISAVILSGNACIFSASNAFVDKLTEDLGAEYKSDGIIFQLIRPGPVATKLIPIDASWSVPLPETYVESALSTVGFSSESNGYLPHSILQYLFQFMNFMFPTTSIKLSLKSMETFRNQIFDKSCCELENS